MIKLTGVKYTEGLLLARYIYAACTGTNDSFCFSGAFQSPFHEIKSLKRFSLSLFSLLCENCNLLSQCPGYAQSPKDTYALA